MGEEAVVDLIAVLRAAGYESAALGELRASLHIGLDEPSGIKLRCVECISVRRRVRSP